mmetsp:Transcript_1215/g.2936  ORF Transcript_1215/g.2936 Transcript_1215/m.2936 type:complete len:545 (+) Transcript_1215:114-1748(+)
MLNSGTPESSAALARVAAPASRGRHSSEETEALLYDRFRNDYDAHQAPPESLEIGSGGRSSERVVDSLHDHEDGGLRRPGLCANCLKLLNTCYILRYQLLGAGVYSFISAAKNISFLPFIRTMIECESDIPAVDHRSTQWSGSSFCTDLSLVAREAQYMKGWAEGLDQGFHCLALPLLGHAIDCFGRRWGVMMGMSGIFMQCTFYYVAAILGSGTLSQVMLITGSITQGLTGIFMASVSASVRDMQILDKSADREASKTQTNDFAMLQISQGLYAGLALVLATLLIIAKNMESYTNIWFGFACAAAGSIVVLFFVFPETLQERMAWQWRKASPLSLLDLMRVKGAQGWVALMVFFEVVSFSTLTTLQAFTISAYHWSQTKATVAYVVLGPVIILSVVAYFFVIPRVSLYHVLVGKLLLLDIGMFFISLAGKGPTFLLVGAGFLCASAGSFPAMVQIIANLAGPDEVGQLMANMGAIALAAVALGNVFFGYLFRTFVSIPSLSFIVGFPFMLLATFCGIKAKQAHERSSGQVAAATESRNEDVSP